MNEIKYIASLDIGAKLTKLAVWVEDGPEGPGPQVFYEIMPSKGIYENAVSNKTELKRNIERMLKSLEARAGFRIREVFVAYAGRDRLIAYTAETVCKTYEEGSSLTVVSEKDLLQVEADTHNCELEKDELIYDKEPVVYLANGHPINGLNVNTYADRFACRYNIFAAHEKDVQKLERGLQEASLQVKAKVCSMRTMNRFYLPGELIPSGTAILNVGASRSQLGVFVDGHLRHYKTFAFGGNVLTHLLKEALGYSPERAEQAKRNEIDINMQLPLTEEVPTSLFVKSNEPPSPLLVVWAEVVTHFKTINEQLREWDVSNLIRNGNGIILTGGGLAFQNIQTYVESLFACMGMPLRVIKPVKTDHPLVPCSEEAADYDPSILGAALSLLAFAQKNGDYSRCGRPAPAAAPEPEPEAAPEEPTPQEPAAKEGEKPQNLLSKGFHQLKSWVSGTIFGDTSFDE
ncbi:MAG: hypothetical protein CSA07_04580 [Bacteroidia bacterium]|nr:MAG: hypothetical protein CSA07_04580 [Bacteroidia bacterium]